MRSIGQGLSVERQVSPGQPAQGKLTRALASAVTRGEHLTCPGTSGGLAQPGEGGSWSQAGPPATPAYPLLELALLVTAAVGMGLPRNSSKVSVSQAPWLLCV